MKIITSKENPTYKNALRLKRKKYRDETGSYLLEGVKPLEDALDMGRKAMTVFVEEGGQPERWLEGQHTVMLSRPLFRALSDTEAPQGIIAAVEMRNYDIDGFRKLVGGRNVLIMDRLQDPGNIGTIIRTAEAAGYGGIVMMAGSGDVYAPKVVRAAAGSLFRVPVIKAGKAGDVIRMVREMGKRLAVTCPEGGINCFEADIVSDTALVIGNEGNGVSEDFIDAADVKIRIPMEGSIESLNAAVAAGILMYQSRKR